MENEKLQFHTDPENPPNSFPIGHEIKLNNLSMLCFTHKSKLIWTNFAKQRYSEEDRSIVEAYASS